MKDHYTLDNLRRALRNPVLIGREALRLASWPVHQMSGRYTNSQYDNESIDVMSEDWDNLVLLDAARFDYFEDLNTIDGSLRKEVSHGKKSWEFIEKALSAAISTIPFTSPRIRSQQTFQKGRFTMSITCMQMPGTNASGQSNRRMLSRLRSRLTKVPEQASHHPLYAASPSVPRGDRRDAP